MEGVLYVYLILCLVVDTISFRGLSTYGLRWMRLNNQKSSIVPVSIYTASDYKTLFPPSLQSCDAIIDTDQEIPHNSIKSLCIVRSSLDKILNSTTVWSLPPNTSLPSVLSFTSFVEKNSEIPSDEYLTDLCALVPTTAMRMGEYHNKVCSLPWTRLDGRPGRRLLGALQYYIEKQEKLLDVQPELFEDVMYAGKWRQIFLKLSLMRDEGIYLDCTIKLVLSNRILNIFNEVLEYWYNDDDVDPMDQTWALSQCIKRYREHPIAVGCSRTPLSLFKVGTNADPCSNIIERKLARFDDRLMSSLEKKICAFGEYDLGGAMVRVSPHNLCKQPLWTLPVGSLLPSGFAVTCTENGRSYYGENRRGHEVIQIPDNVAELNMRAIPGPEADRWMLTTTIPMPLMEFESKLSCLPWERVKDATGLRSPESEEPHMMFRGRGDERFALLALADFIQTHEAQLSTDPEYWEHIVHAGFMRRKIKTLCEMRDSMQFTDLLPATVPFCPHTVLLLKEVLHWWKTRDVPASCRDLSASYIEGLRTTVIARNVIVNYN